MTEHETPMDKRSLRILYAAGPGDVIQTYRHWVRGCDDPSQVSVTSSGMFYDVCRERGDAAYVISTCPRRDRLIDRQFRIVHRPTRFFTRRAPLYHLGQIWTAIRLVASALWFRADVAVIVCGTTHWFLLRILPWLGIKVVPSLHCVIWPKYQPLSRVQRLISRAATEMFTSSATCILSTSHDISAQVRTLTRGRNRPLLPFVPTYRASRFEQVRPPDPPHRPFRVCFAGRIESDKGVFDLLSIATRFQSAGRHDIHFDICGNGSALEELRRQARGAGLADRFVCHGHCNWETMQEMYSLSHVVIVPTTTMFVEGFNMVVAEAVLAGRPVITSSVCPAMEYIGAAAIEVPADDVIAYGDAILRLCDDPELYRRKCEGCIPARRQFLDAGLGWAEALRRALRSVHSLDSAVEYPAEVSGAR
jgi:glycosyltransferase involved in cell wall biosynthesis